MAEPGWVLAIDFGTSYTTVAIAEAGRVELIEIDGVRAMPSGVWLDAGGALVVGTSAERQARLAPERWERAPKRLIGEVAPLLLGDRQVPVVEAVAAVLRHAAGEAMRQQGRPPEEVRLTHPARWSGRRLGALQAAASIAGLGIPVLAAPPRPLPEPVAAALYFADRGQLPAGAQVAVYDLGGGTFDTAVLAADGRGYAVRALGGLEGFGGEHFDALLYAHVGAQLGARDPLVWDTLQDPPDARWRRAGEDLYREVRRGKEDLSKYPAVTLDTEPLVGVPLQLTRAELESVLRPKIEATARELAETIARAGQRPADLTAVYLAGGSSRIPLVERIVSDTLRVNARVLGEPKTVVVAGAARWTLRDRVDVPARPIPTPVPDGPRAPRIAPAVDAEETRIDTPARRYEPAAGAGYRPIPVVGSVDQTSRPRRRPWWRHPASIVAAVAVLILAGIGTVLLANNPPPDGGSDPLPAPANFTAKTAMNAVQLSWEPVPSAAGYVVYRDSKLVSGPNHIQTGFADKPGDTKSHRYFVQAVDDTGQNFGTRSATISGQAVLNAAETALVHRLSSGLVDPFSCVSNGVSITGVKCNAGAPATQPSPPAVTPSTIYAYKYSDHDSLVRARDQAISKALARDINSLSRDCTQPPSKNSWNFTNDADTVERGQLYCYVYENTATVEWSYVNDAILLVADAATDNLNGLHQWWLDGGAALGPS